MPNSKIPDPSSVSARLPPRWFIRLAWIVHRALYRVTGGRLGLWRPRPGGWGTLRLTTIGRRSGRARAVMVGYFEDGPNLVTMAMNGWGEGEPAWWLNLQSHPAATAELADGSRQVTARAATGKERTRLWSRWQQIDQHLDAYAARRSMPTAVVVLEPRSAGETDPAGRAQVGVDPGRDPLESSQGSGPGPAVSA